MNVVSGLILSYHGVTEFTASLKATRLSLFMLRTQSGVETVCFIVLWVGIETAISGNIAIKKIQHSLIC